MEIAICLGGEGLGGSVIDQSGGGQYASHKGKEENEEGHGVDEHLAAQTRTQFLIVEVVQEIEGTEDAGEEDDSQAEHPVPRTEEGIETVPGVAPATDDRTGVCHAQAKRIVCDEEIAAGEERGDCCADDEGTDHTVENEEATIAAATEHVAGLCLKLIGDSLKHEAHEDEHPNPVGAAEGGAVEQWETGEEGAAEGDEGREGQFPFASGGTNDEFAFFLISSEAEDEAVGALHEHQEDEEAAEEAH